MPRTTKKGRINSNCKEDKDCLNKNCVNGKCTRKNARASSSTSRNPTLLRNITSTLSTVLEDTTDLINSINPTSLSKSASPKKYSSDEMSVAKTLVNDLPNSPTPVIPCNICGEMKELLIKCPYANNNVPCGASVCIDCTTKLCKTSLNAHTYSYAQPNTLNPDTGFRYRMKMQCPICRGDWTNVCKEVGVVMNSPSAPRHEPSDAPDVDFDDEGTPYMQSPVDDDASVDFESDSPDEDGLINRMDPVHGRVRVNPGNGDVYAYDDDELLGEWDDEENRIIGSSPQARFSSASASPISNTSSASLSRIASLHTPSYLRSNSQSSVSLPSEEALDSAATSPPKSPMDLSMTPDSNSLPGSNSLPSEESMQSGLTSPPKTPVDLSASFEAEDDDRRHYSDDGVSSASTGGKKKRKYNKRTKKHKSHKNKSRANRRRTKKH